MNEKKVRLLIDKGESLQIEFKESKNALTKDAYDTVCAFLNTAGGKILLGVKDNGAIVGITPSEVQKIKNDFVTGINNPNKLNPVFYLTIEEVVVEDKVVLYIFVPESSQVHRHNGKIYLRIKDGDFDITDNTNLVAQIYARKQNTYFENKIFPFIQFQDFKPELILRARKLASNQQPNHPWKELTDEELVRSVGLYLKDVTTGQEGFTMASILLLGKDEVILSALPYHKTDAILRRENIDRYDDRDDIRCNLVESYDRLMAFCVKHLIDPFFTESDQRISLRDKIFREVVSNLLIHREYSNAFPAKLIISGDRVTTENANKPNYFGKIGG